MKWEDSSEEKISPAVKRLNETLRKNNFPINLFSSTRLEILHDRLKEAMKDENLSEILMKDQSGAVAKILDIVWDAARDPELTIGRRIAVVVTSDSPVIRIPKAAKSIHGFVGGTGRPRASEEKYEFVDITVRTSAGIARISREMIDDAAWDVIERQLRELGAAYSEFQSTYILNQMVNDAGVSINATNSGTLQFKDVATLYAQMWNEKKRKADVLVLNPTEFSDLLKDTAIQNWIVYRRSDLEGEVPYLAGLRLEVTSLLPSGTALMIDTKHAGVLFIRRDLMIEEVNDPISDLVEAPARARWNYKTIDSGAIGKINNA